MASIVKYETDVSGWASLFSEIATPVPDALKNMIDQISDFAKQVMADKSAPPKTDSELIEAVISKMSEQLTDGFGLEVVQTLTELMFVLNTGGFKNAKKLNMVSDLCYMFGNGTQLEICGVSQDFGTTNGRVMLPYVTDEFAAQCSMTVDADFFKTNSSGVPSVYPVSPKFALLRTDLSRRVGVLLVRMPRVSELFKYNDPAWVFAQEVLVVPDNMCPDYLVEHMNVSPWPVCRDLPVELDHAFPVFCTADYTASMVDHTVNVREGVILKMFPIDGACSHPDVVNKSEAAADVPAAESDDPVSAELLAAAADSDTACGYPFYVKDLHKKTSGKAKPGPNTLIYYVDGSINYVTSSVEFFEGLEVCKGSGKNTIATICEALFNEDVSVKTKTSKDGTVLSEFDLINQRAGTTFTSNVEVRQAIRAMLAERLTPESVHKLFTMCAVSDVEIFSRDVVGHLDVKYRRRGVEYVSKLACMALGVHVSWCPIINCAMELHSAKIPQPTCGAVLKMAQCDTSYREWEIKPVGGFKATMIQTLVYAGSLRWLAVPLEQRKMLCELYKINNRFEESACTTFVVGHCEPIRKRDMNIKDGSPQTDALTLLMYQESESVENFAAMATDSNRRAAMFEIKQVQVKAPSRKRKATDGASATKAKKTAAAKSSEDKIAQYKKMRAAMAALAAEIGDLEDDTSLPEMPQQQQPASFSKLVEVVETPTEAKSIVPEAPKNKLIVPQKPVSKMTVVESAEPAAKKLKQTTLPLTGEVRHIPGTSPAKAAAMSKLKSAVPVVSKTPTPIPTEAAKKATKRPDISDSESSDSEDEDMEVSTSAGTGPVANRMIEPIYSSSEDEDDDEESAASNIHGNDNGCNMIA